MSPTRIDTRALVLLAALTAASFWAARAGAQALQPATGTTTNVEGLRQQIEGLYGIDGETGGTPAEPGWTVVPSISLMQEWTNSAGGSGSGSRSGEQQDSFITVIQPGLLVNADTNLVKGTLSWSPSASIYENSSNQNQFANYLNANATVTLLPEHFFLKLYGYGSLQATSGGLGPNNTTALNNQNATQTYNFGATPYLRNRFGDLGTAELGVAVSHTSQQGLSSQSTFVPQSLSSDQSLNSIREYLVFTSGPALGRMTVVANASADQMSGSGVSNGAYRNVATVDVGYAITRTITPLVTVGYEDLLYATVPVYRVDDAIWKVGMRWAPDPDSVLVMRYGHQDGRNGPTFNGSYALTARLRLYGSYTEGLSSALQSLSDALQASVLDPLGNPIDPQTNAPLQLSSNFFGVQSNNILYWVKRGSLTATLLFDRDAVSVGVSYQSQQSVGVSIDTFGIMGASATEGTYGSVSWQHDLRPDLKVTSYFLYGRSSDTFGAIPFGTIQQSAATYAGSLSLTYQFGPTLVGLIQYSYSSQSSTGLNNPASLVLVGLRKTF